MNKKQHVPQMFRTGRERPVPMIPKMKAQGSQAPVARVNGQELVHAKPTAVDVAAPAGENVVSSAPGAPRSTAGQRKAIAAGQRPGRPMVPRFKAMVFGNGSSDPFR